MKGASGIILAAFLGALAMLFNWAYLENRMHAIETVSLLGVAPETRVELGDVLRAEHLVEVKIPSANAAMLRDVAYLYEDRKSLIGMRATRVYAAGDLILRRDYRTAPPELVLAQDERLIWIPVDSRSFVPELLNPGDDVTFLIPIVTATTAAPGPSEDEDDFDAPPVTLPQASPLTPGDAFGPFRVASIGTRLASQSIAQAVQATSLQDRQIGIIVKAPNQRLDPRALQLLDRLSRNDYRQVSVILHPRTVRGE